MAWAERYSKNSVLPAPVVPITNMCVRISESENHTGCFIDISKPMQYSGVPGFCSLPKEERPSGKGALA